LWLGYGDPGHFVNEGAPVDLAAFVRADGEIGNFML
jgi:hypothetical protein